MVKRWGFGELVLYEKKFKSKNFPLTTLWKLLKYKWLNAVMATKNKKLEEVSSDRYVNRNEGAKLVMGYIKDVCKNTKKRNKTKNLTSVTNATKGKNNYTRLYGNWNKYK